MLAHHPLDGVNNRGERQPALEEGGDAMLVRGIVDSRPGAPELPRLPGQGNSWKFVLVERIQIPRMLFVQSMAGAAPGTRSGQARPRAIGRCMSGGPTWASTEPSVNCIRSYNMS